MDRCGNLVFFIWVEIGLDQVQFRIDDAIALRQDMGVALNRIFRDVGTCKRDP